MHQSDSYYAETVAHVFYNTCRHDHVEIILYMLLPSNLHPVASYIDPLAVFRGKYGQYLRKLHAKAQCYDAVAECSTNEQNCIHFHSGMLQLVLTWHFFNRKSCDNITKVGHEVYSTGTRVRVISKGHKTADFELCGVQKIKRVVFVKH